MRLLLTAILWLSTFSIPVTASAKPNRVINPLLLELAKEPIYFAPKDDQATLMDGYRFAAYSAPDGYWLPVYIGEGRSTKRFDQLGHGESAHVIELKKIGNQYRAYIVPPACMRSLTNEWRYVGAPTECSFDPKKPLTAPWVDAVYLR